MVADNDKNGEEYNPEVSGVEHPEEISEDEYSPVRDEEPVAGTAAVQEKSSPLKKVGVAIVLIVAVFAVASYLTHKKKVRLAEQSETTAIVTNSIAAPAPESNNDSESAKSDQATKTDVVENKPADKPELKPEAPASTAAPSVVTQKEESGAKPEKTDAVIPTSSKQLEDSAAKMAMAADTSAPPKTDSANASVAEAITAATPAPTAETPATPVATQVPNDIDKQISALKEQAKTNETKLNDINTHVTNLDNAISKLNNSISTLDKKIGDMTVVSKVDRKPVTRERIVMQKRPLRPVKLERNRPKHAMMNMGMNAVENTAGKSGHENFDKTAYNIRAIVPGRAWIESPSGYKFSISVGDRVLGYGTVTQINADYGEVTFDGGDVIKYGSDDH